MPSVGGKFIGNSFYTTSRQNTKLMKTITIETSSGKEYFEIEEYSNKFYIYKLDYSGFWSTKKRIAVGETKSFEDAIAIAKTSISGSFRKIEIS